MRSFTLILAIVLVFTSCKDEEIIYWDKDYIIVGDLAQVGLRSYDLKPDSIAVLYNDRSTSFSLDLNQDGTTDITIGESDGHTKVSSFLNVSINSTSSSPEFYIVCDVNKNALVYALGDTLKNTDRFQEIYATIFEESHSDCESENGCTHRQQGHWDDTTRQYVGIVTDTGKLGWIHMSLGGNELRLHSYGLLR